MSQPTRSAVRFLPDTWRVENWSELHPDAKRKTIGITLAIALEVLLLLALFTLGYSKRSDDPVDVAMVSFDVQPETEEDPSPVDTQEPEFAEARPAALPAPAVVDAPVPLSDDPREAEVAPTPTRPAFISLTREQMAAADIRGKKPGTAAAKGPVGPPDTGFPGDSKRIGGSGPNGEPLYAASWYREPYPEELRGYLSTASGPGWALINCQTVKNFRVENCVLVAEHPTSSRIGNAVLQAAWQFRVRPPRVGGQSKVGEWVRIRIDYTRYRE